MIKNINQASVQAQKVRNYHAETIGKKPKDKAKAEEKEKVNNGVIYTHDVPEDVSPSAYNRQGLKIEDQASAIDEMKKAAEQKYQALLDMVREMIRKQGLNADEILGKIDAGEEVMVEISPEVRESAQAEIAEGGYWSVEATSGRILKFAETLANGDGSSLGMLKDAFIAGFEAAKEAFGGELPDISQKTYDAVMEGFEALDEKLNG